LGVGHEAKKKKKKKKKYCYETSRGGKSPPRAVEPMMMNLMHRQAYSKEMVFVIVSSVLLFVADVLNLGRKLVLYFTHMWDELWVSRSFFFALYLCVSSSLFFVCVSSFLE
jgi:hypothetical protein